MYRKQLGPLTYKFRKFFLKNKGLDHGHKAEGAWNSYLKFVWSATSSLRRLASISRSAVDASLFSSSCYISKEGK